MQKNILITGEPKSGKSTLLAKLISTIPNKIGFLTNEIRVQNNRVGFEAQNHLQHKALLADISAQTPLKVSKYFVDIRNLDLLIPEVSNFKGADVLYLDEIGQMQLFSNLFKELVLRFINSPNTCIATLSYIYDDDFIRHLKKRDDIILIEITPENREEKGLFIKELLKKIEKARKYLSEPERFIKLGSAEITLISEHGTRKLVCQNGQWKCGCTFYNQYGICSHSIATKEFLRH